MRFGGGRIRTHETREGLTVFKTAAFDHSATPPLFFTPECLSNKKRPQRSNLAVSKNETYGQSYKDFNKGFYAKKRRMVRDRKQWRPLSQKPAF